MRPTKPQADLVATRNACVCVCVCMCVRIYVEVGVNPGQQDLSILGGSRFPGRPQTTTKREIFHQPPDKVDQDCLAKWYEKDDFFTDIYYAREIVPSSPHGVYIDINLIPFLLCHVYLDLGAPLKAPSRWPQGRRSYLTYCHVCMYLHI